MHAAKILHVHFIVLNHRCFFCGVFLGEKPCTHEHWNFVLYLLFVIASLNISVSAENSYFFFWTKIYIQLTVLRKLGVNEACNKVYNKFSSLNNLNHSTISAWYNNRYKEEEEEKKKRRLWGIKSRMHRWTLPFFLLCSTTVCQRLWVEPTNAQAMD